MDHRIASEYIRRYFVPSVRVLERAEFFRNKYQISPEHTIGLYVRGTDKWTETGSVAPAYYFNEVADLLRKNPTLRVFVQTDQRQLLDCYLGEFRNRAFFIEELPSTDGLGGIHLLSDEEREWVGGRTTMATDMLAVVWLLSKCQYLVFNTSNVSLWIILFRGGAFQSSQYLAGRPDVISTINSRKLPLLHRIAVIFRSRMRRFLMK